MAVQKIVPGLQRSSAAGRRKARREMHVRPRHSQRIGAAGKRGRKSVRAPTMTSRGKTALMGIAEKLSGVGEWRHLRDQAATARNRLRSMSADLGAQQEK